MSDVKKFSEVASDKVVELPPVDGGEKETNDATEPNGPDNNDGSGWNFETIGLALVIILVIGGIMWGVGKSLYNAGRDAAEDEIFITRETLPGILAQEFTPGEIERIMYDVNNIHYDVEGGLSSGETITIHQKHTRSYHDNNDDYYDIVIDLYYSSWKHAWEISSYTWPNRYACECRDCPCSCVVPSII